MKFRKDINGLRAFAVIGVLLFHFNASWMPGGFAGVDVFFVISGFLMTGIIFRGIEQEKFSILNFYVARANRIIPALALLCLVLLFFGWFYLTPIEYRALGKHAASSISFLSNFAYWREAGYFDAASHEKWLLHTWTLSVEWQFYIIYPLILVAMRKFLSTKTMKLTILVATVLAFIFCVYSTYKWPNASYFLLSARAWEMLIGGVAYLYPFTLQEKKKKFVEVIGLSLVIGSYFLISAENAWPGYLALFPVVGSFLIIQAQCNDSWITGNILFQKLGTWSYSIYLWHWPLVVAIYYFSSNGSYIYLGMALSILLGFLSYKYVEKINFPRSFPTLLSYLKCKPIYIALLCMSVGLFPYITNGANLSYRSGANSEKAKFLDYYALQEKENKAEDYWLKCDMYAAFKKGNTYEIDESCVKNSEPDGVLLWGDSHAQALSLGLRELLDVQNVPFSQVTSSGCRPSIRPDTYEQEEIRKPCDYSNKLAIEVIKEINPKLIILAQRDRHDKQNWIEISKKISGISDARLVIIGPISQWEKSLPNIILKPKHWNKKQEFISDTDLNLDVIETDKAMRSVGLNEHYTYISLIREMCREDVSSNGQYCRAFTPNDRLVQTDYGHLSRDGSVYIVNNILADSLLDLYYSSKQ